MLVVRCPAAVVYGNALRPDAAAGSGAFEHVSRRDGVSHVLMPVVRDKPRRSEPAAGGGVDADVERARSDDSPVGEIQPAIGRVESPRSTAAEVDAQELHIGGRRRIDEARRDVVNTRRYGGCAD